MSEEEEEVAVKILVRDRQAGKTTELIEWLFEGHEIEDYPGWSRVIVCVSHKMVVNTTTYVRTISDRINFHSCARMLPHDSWRCEAVQKRYLNNIRKAVWSLADLHHNLRGASREFEYGVDDADWFLMNRGLDLLGYKMPAVIVMTGEHVDSLCD